MILTAWFMRGLWPTTVTRSFYRVSRGAGKSTLAAALALSDYRCYSDETAILDASTRARAFPNSDHIEAGRPASVVGRLPGLIPGDQSLRHVVSPDGIPRVIGVHRPCGTAVVLAFHAGQPPHATLDDRSGGWHKGRPPWSR